MGGSYGKVYGNEGPNILGKSLEFSVFYYHVPLERKVQKEVTEILCCDPIGILAHPKLKNGFMKPACTPQINGWNLRIHLFEKENHLPKNHHFQVQVVNLRGCKHVAFPFR